MCQYPQCGAESRQICENSTDRLAHSTIQRQLPQINCGRIGVGFCFEIQISHSDCVSSKSDVLRDCICNELSETSTPSLFELSFVISSRDAPSATISGAANEMVT